MVPDQLGLNTITLGESDASLKLYSKASTVSVSKQTADDGSAGCNNYTLLLLDRLACSSIPDLLLSVLFSQNRLTETSGCRE